MKRFFPRIFIVVWLAAVLTGAGVTAIDALANPPAHVEEQHNLISDAIRLEAIESMQDATQDNDPSARLSAFRERTGATIYIFRDDGELFAPKPAPIPVQEMADRVRLEGDLEEQRDNATLVGIRLPNTHYVAVGRVWRTPAWARALGGDQPVVRLVLLILASALLAFFLSRYLMRPVRSLRRATQRIARGDLEARVGTELGHGVLAELGTDFDAMAERVEELLETQQRLLTDVSHELNSPLARLRVALELARGHAGGDAASAHDRIEREAERLGALVDEILTFARLEGGELSMAPLDLAALVSEVARDAQFESANEAEVTLAEVTPTRLTGNEKLLRRALDNVLRNALRFTAVDTEVEVSLEHDAENVVITVRDRGPGVPEDALEAIFEPLYRVESDRGRSTGGAGLGLAIARRAVALHEGTIEAQNVEDGGFFVRLTLPLNAAGAFNKRAKDRA